MTAIVEYSKTEAALADLAQRFKGVIYDVTKPDGMVEAKKARAELRDYRVSLEATRVEIKAPALERCRLIDAEAKRITTALTALESPIDAQIKREEQRKEDERNAEIRAEQERLAAAERARKKAEEEKLAAERQWLEDERAKLEATQRAARQKIEEENRAAQRARDEADRVAREARQAEENRLRKEREAVEAERRATEEAARKLREEQEAKARAERLEIERKERAERERQEAEARAERLKAQELQDGYGLLESFVKRFGKRKEFAPAVAAIRAFLSRKEAA